MHVYEHTHICKLVGAARAHEHARAHSFVDSVVHDPSADVAWHAHRRVGFERLVRMLPRHARARDGGRLRRRGGLERRRPLYDDHRDFRTQIKAVTPKMPTRIFAVMDACTNALCVGAACFAAWA